MTDRVKKIESVVLYILNKFKDGTDYIKLFKIMYFAQREYLADYGLVLCPDTFKARTFGPVPALSDKVLKMVETEEVEVDSNLKHFCSSIVIKNQTAFAKRKADTDYLSQKEREYLDKWYELCKDQDSVKVLSRKSHDYAYKQALKRCRRDPQLDMLTNMDIAKAGGATEEMLEYIHEKELIAQELA